MSADNESSKKEPPSSGDIQTEPEGKGSKPAATPDRQNPSAKAESLGKGGAEQFAKNDAARGADSQESQQARPSGSKHDHFATGEALRQKEEKKKKQTKTIVAIVFGIVGLIVGTITLAWYLQNRKKKKPELSDKTKEALK